MTAYPTDIDGNEAQRLTLTVEGNNVAFVEFYLFGTVAIVTHTEVEIACQGKGLGSLAASQALDHFRSQNWSVVPVCDFFLRHIRQHPEYTGLLTPDCRRIFAV